VIDLAEELAHIGVDGILSVTYSTKPTQEGLLPALRAIASSVSLPIVILQVQIARV